MYTPVSPPQSRYWIFSLCPFLPFCRQNHLVLGDEGFYLLYYFSEKSLISIYTCFCIYTLFSDFWSFATSHSHVSESSMLSWEPLVHSFLSLSSIPWDDYILFIHPLDTHLGCFHFVTLMNNVAMNTYTQVYDIWMYIVSQLGKT